MFPRRFQNLEERVSIFLSIRATTNHITKRKTSTHLCGRNTENSSTGASTQASCRFFIYIAYLLNRHGISCNPCHAEKARHCLVCHAAPRGMVPDSCGCGSVRVKRRNTPCLGDCQENTTLSGGGQPPPSRNTSGVTLTPQPDLQIGTILLRNRSPFRGNFFRTGCQYAGYLPLGRKITS